MTIRVKSAPVNDFTSNVCGETAGSLHYISGITPERAKQVLNIDKGGGNPPLTYFMGVAERGSVVSEAGNVMVWKETY